MAIVLVLVLAAIMNAAYSGSGRLGMPQVVQLRPAIPEPNNDSDEFDRLIRKTAVILTQLIEYIKRFVNREE